VDWYAGSAAPVQLSIGSNVAEYATQSLGPELQPYGWEKLFYLVCKAGGCSRPRDKKTLI
jgi:hypothetical protein